MFQPTPKKRVLFVRSLRLALLVVFGVFSLLALFLRAPGQAHALTSSDLNFQARLETSAGAIAPDGNYNVQFKIYSGASCVPATGSGCTAVWTETYQNSNSQGIRVANGYLTANLGSITSFPTGIDWSQQLYISMNIGGTSTSASPTYDGEMKPFLQLTAVPYAFQAAQATQLSQANSAGTFTSTLNLLQPTGGNQIFQIPDQGAGGTFTICTVQTCTGANSGSGNGNYIENGSSLQSGASFNISGNGIAGTLQAGTFDTASAGALSIGTTNATSISLKQNTNIASGKSLTVLGGATILNGLSTGSTTALTVNTGASSNIGVVVQGSASQSADLLQLYNGTTLEAKITSGGLLGIANTIKGFDTATASTNSNNINIQSGSATGTTSNSGSVTIDSGTATGTAGPINIGTTNAGAVNIGRSATTTTIAGTAALTGSATVTGTVNSIGGYQFNSTAGSTITCSGGNVLQNQVVQGGITTGGSCAAVSGGSGVTTVGTIDGGSYSANGASISGTTVYLQTASATQVGLVNTGAQTLAGAKTFSSIITGNAGLAVTGNSTIAGTLSGLTGLSSSGAITFSALNAAGIVTNTAGGALSTVSKVPVANGGTGAATFTTGGILFGNGTSAITASGVLTNGQLLIGDGSGAPTAGTLASSGGISITNGAGTITIGTNTTVCTTSGNCVGTGGAGGAIGGSGTANTLAMFTAAGTIGNSILSQSGTTVAVAGNIQATVVDANTLQTNGTQRLDASGNLSNIGTYTGSGNITITSGILNAQGSGINSLSGSLHVGSSGQLQVDASGNVSTTGTELVKNTGTAVFSVQSASSATPILGVDTTDQRVGINMASPQASLDVSGNANFTTTASQGSVAIDVTQNDTSQDAIWISASGTATTTTISTSSNSSISTGIESATTLTSGASTLTTIHMDSSHVVNIMGSSPNIYADVGTYLNSTVTYGSQTTLPVYSPYSSESATAGSTVSATPLDSTRFVLTYGLDTYNSGTGVTTQQEAVVICTISGSSVTGCGTPVYAEANAGNSVYEGSSAVTALSSTTFALSWAADPTTNPANYIGTTGRSVVGTVSGTTITLGTPVTFSATATSFVSIAATSATSFVTSFTDNGNSSQGAAVAATVSGTAITQGAKTVFSAAATPSSNITPLSSTQVGIAYINGANGNAAYALVGTISGTTISFGSPTVFDVGSNATPSLVTLSATQMVVSYLQSTTVLTATLSVSGTTITAGAPASIQTTLTGITLLGTVPLDGTRVYHLYGSSASNATRGEIVSYAASVGGGGVATPAPANFVVTKNGETTVATNSNTAFQIQNAAGTDLLTTDTVNNIVQINDKAGNAVLYVDAGNHKVGINTAAPGTALSVNGGNNVDPSWPDGQAGTPVLASASISASTATAYTVPGGKSLYMTYYRLSGSGSTGCSLNIGGIGYASANTTSPLAVQSFGTPFIIPGGTAVTISCGTSSTGSLSIDGYVTSSNGLGGP